MPELSPMQVAEPRRGPQKRLMTHQDCALEPPRKLSKKLPKKEEAVLFESSPSLQTPPPQEDSVEFTFPTPVMELWGEMDHDSTNRCQENPPVAQDMWCPTNNNLGFFAPAADVEDYTLGGCVAPAEAEGNLMAILATGGVEQKQEIEYKYMMKQKECIEYEYMVDNNGVLSMEQEQESLETEKDAMDKIMQEAGIALTPFADWDWSGTGLGQPTTEDFVLQPECPAMLTTMLTGVDEEVDPEDPNDPTYDPEADLLASMPSTSTRTSARFYAKKSLPAILKPVKRLAWGKRTKKPGRPQREDDYEITAVPSRMEINARGLTKNEVDGLKYRRQRDLNNLASQKCRAKRGVKVNQKEHELVNETERNMNLRKKAAHMEEQILILKDQMTNAQLVHVRVMMGHL